VQRLKERWPSGVPAALGESGKRGRSDPQTVCVVAECVPMGMSEREDGRFLLSLLDERRQERSDQGCGFVCEWKKVEYGLGKKAEGKLDWGEGLAALQLWEHEDDAVVSCAFPAAPQP
jgi:hypothetical protein